MRMGNVLVIVFVIVKNKQKCVYLSVGSALIQETPKGFSIYIYVSLHQRGNDGIVYY